MSKIIQYALYEAKIFFRIKVSVFYSIIFPIVMLLLYYFANEGANRAEHVNSYFPYLISITLISTAAGLTSIIVNNRNYNMWKFYNFFGYKTWHMTVATGFIYFMLSEIICLLMSGIMILLFHSTEISFSRLLMFLVAVGVGTILYIEIAIIIGLAINDPKNAQTIINVGIYLFVILSGSIVQFDQTSLFGKVVSVFPNIHLGNFLSAIWNHSELNYFSILWLMLYIVFFILVIHFLIKKEHKKLLY